MEHNTDIVEYVPKEEAPDVSNFEKDFEYARLNIIQTIKTAQEAAKILASVASEEKAARPFEVLNELLRNISLINHELVDMYRKRNDIAPPQQQSAQINISDSAVFVGTAAGLKKALRDLKKEEEEKVNRDDTIDVSPNN
jgi:hypothetical protein